MCVRVCVRVRGEAETEIKLNELFNERTCAITKWCELRARMFYECLWSRKIYYVTPARVECESNTPDTDMNGCTAHSGQQRGRKASSLGPALQFEKCFKAFSSRIESDLCRVY